MHLKIVYGNSAVDLNVAEEDHLPLHRECEPEQLADPLARLRAVLESPFEFPSLRAALIPDDRVAVVVDEDLPGLTAYLPPVLEHICSAGVAPAAITLLFPRGRTGQEWLDAIPDEYDEIRFETHDPSDRSKLAYLATTRGGRRVYLNRTLVDADQIVVLTRRAYDDACGYYGGESAIFPVFSDAATQRDWRDAYSVSGLPASRVAEVDEIVGLLGVPFFIQVIAGRGGKAGHIVAGLHPSNQVAKELLDASWRVEIAEPADVVIATMGQDTERQGFAAFAQALMNATRVAKPGGKIVLLSESRPELGGAASILREADEVGQATRELGESLENDRTAGLQWAYAANHATVYLLSGLTDDEAEELFTVPLHRADEVQRLLHAGRTVAVLPEADKLFACLSQKVLL